MNKYAWIIIISIIIAIIIGIVMRYLKKKTINDLIGYIERQDYTGFDAQTQKWLVRYLVPPFNLDYLKMNSAIIRGDEKMILEAFENFDRHRLNEKQKESVYMTAFNYFISSENYKMAKPYLEKINSLTNAQMKQEANRIYDIYAEKGHKYLEEMIDETEQMEEITRGINEFLIAMMYENKGDMDKAKEYKKLSDKHMKMLDNKISKQQKENQKKHK